MMSIPETPPVGEAPRSVHAMSLPKRTVTVVGTFLVATAFALAGAPAAMAAPAAMNNQLPSAGQLLCDGKFPGCCHQRD